MTPTELSKAAGISVPFASQIISGKRKPSLGMALQIYDAAGVQFGPLAGLDTADIEAARRMAA